MPEILNLFNIYEINASWSIDACPRSVRGFHERFSLHWFPYWPVRASPALCLHCALAACISLSPRSAAFVCGLWLDNPAEGQRQLPTAGSVSSWSDSKPRDWALRTQRADYSCTSDALLLRSVYCRSFRSCIAVRVTFSYCLSNRVDDFFPWAPFSPFCTWLEVYRLRELVL